MCVYDHKHYSLHGFHISFFVTSFALPLVFILLMYVVMLFRLWRSSSCTVSRSPGRQLLAAFIHLKLLTMFLIIQGGYESEEKGDKIGPGGDFGVYR